MKFFRLVGLKLGQLVRQIGQVGAQRKLRLTKNENEAERLDRIRHPEKYRGK